MTASDIPDGPCPLGSLGLHTMNYERTECLWCGPNILGLRPGKWVKTEEGYSAWKTDDAS